MKVVWCASLLIGLAGAASAAPAPWCGKIDRNIDFRISDGDKFNYTSDAEDTADPDAIVNIVGASCARAGDDSSDGDARQCPLVFAASPTRKGPRRSSSLQLRTRSGNEREWPSLWRTTRRVARSVSSAPDESTTRPRYICTP